MADAAGAIEAYTSRGREHFDSDSVVRDAILYQIIVLGEAAKAVVKTAPDLAKDLSSIEWSLLARMRDRVSHQYWETDHEIVWDTATKDIPALHRALTAAIERLS
jgi:uncharacterized protein with HEPN domain